MDDREKLVELLGRVQQMGVIYRENQMDERYPTIEQIRNTEVAACLIANGVTVQEWISVAEPPKEYRNEYGELIPFLVCAEGTDYPFRAMYDGKNWGDGIFFIPVKWWMPLPEPPKGE